jgi:hypothetical protein
VLRNLGGIVLGFWGNELRKRLQVDIGLLDGTTDCCTEPEGNDEGRKLGNVLGALMLVPIVGNSLGTVLFMSKVGNSLGELI